MSHINDFNNSKCMQWGSGEMQDLTLTDLTLTDQVARVYIEGP